MSETRNYFSFVPVQVPESPEMREMWQQVTSPSVVANEDTRLQFATLAQQIIDAIPDRIKQVNFG